MAKLSQLTVAALGMVLQLLLDLFQKTKKTELLSSNQYMGFENDAQHYIGALQKMESSLYSPEVAAAEKGRKNSLSALYKYVKTRIDSPIAAEREAAKRVYALLKVHGTITSIVGLSQGDKTPKLDAIIFHVGTGVSPTDMATLNLSPWIDALTQAQASYLSLFIQRSNSNASEADIVSATKQRPQLEKSLRKLTNFVEAKAILDPDPFWHDLSLQIEERISEVANNSRTKPRTAKGTKRKDKPTLDE